MQLNTNAVSQNAERLSVGAAEAGKRITKIEAMLKLCRTAIATARIYEQRSHSQDKLH
jgi:hypothetical protein